MLHRRDEHTFGAVTVGDIRQAIENRDDDEIVYFDGFSFSGCINTDGNLELRQGDCKHDEEELW
jgi:hypothetical protein